MGVAVESDGEGVGGEEKREGLSLGVGWAVADFEEDVEVAPDGPCELDVEEEAVVSVFAVWVEE